MRALVIDDSRAMRAILKQSLRPLHCEVVEAGNGREALERITSDASPFDLALVDWNMPEMNGFEFVQAVRADRRHDAMRIMMVTTETEMDRVAMALDAGANEYVMKPFSSEVIADKLGMLGLTATEG
jgi:two-component system chemotaxis response regulator CheY